MTPTQKMKSSLSDSGTVNMADPTHDKGKSALVDRFRKREERWRVEQAFHDQEAAHAAETNIQAGPEAAAVADSETGAVADPEAPGEGGGS